MFCPCCGTQNLHTALQCIQCGTTLIKETEVHSDDFKKGARIVDFRMYSGVGAFLGIALAAILLISAPHELYGREKIVVVTCVVIGGVLGRVIAWSKWRDS